ncbi:MAG: efflux RND transporter permease subunit [Comamonadaceae bacterium]|nr:efflux RND transporter permease subunit [Comamonadaceae bacterium]
MQYLQAAIDRAGRRPRRPDRRRHAAGAARADRRARSSALILRARAAHRRCSCAARTARATRPAPSAGDPRRRWRTAAKSCRSTSVATLERVDGPVKVRARERARAWRWCRRTSRAATWWASSTRRKAAVGRRGHSCRTGYRIAWGGQFENQQRAAQRLAIVVPVALGLIFCPAVRHLRLGARRRCWCLTNIPFALIGGVFALCDVGRVPVGAGLGRLHRAAGHRGAERRGAGQPLQPAARAAA